MKLEIKKIHKYMEIKNILSNSQWIKTEIERKNLKYLETNEIQTQYIKIYEIQENSSKKKVWLKRDLKQSKFISSGLE